MSNMEQLRYLDELRYLATELRATVNQLYGYVRGPDAYDRLKEKESQASRAEEAERKLRAWILDGSNGCSKCADREIAETENLPPESCTCFLGHAPCSYCENSCECEKCGDIFYSPGDERDEPLCETCEESADD